MQKLKPSQRANDNLFVKNIQSLVPRAKCNAVGHTVLDSLELIEQLPEVKLPCRASDIYPVYERLPVLNQTMFPRTRYALTNYLDEIEEDCFLLVPDAMLTGKDMLWLVGYLGDKHRLFDLIKNVIDLKLVIGNLNGADIIAMSFHSFVRV